jgi:hypothetical protein
MSIEISTFPAASQAKLTSEQSKNITDKFKSKYLDKKFNVKIEELDEKVPLSKVKFFNLLFLSSHNS